MADLLNGKTCIVTGASRGIGKAIASLFASEGADVIVNSSTLGSSDYWISNDPNTDRLHPYYFDVSNSEEVRNNILYIKNRFKHIDVLINNAGVEYNELIGMISSENMHKTFEVNVFGAIEMIQSVSRIMARNQNGGVIINISSLVALRGNPGQLVYAASKGALNSITKTAAKELASKNIRVNSIAPGLTKTEMMEKVEIEKLDKRISNISLGRIAQPEDIAGACLMLATDYSNYISGQIIAVDGCTIM